MHAMADTVDFPARMARLAARLLLFLVIWVGAITASAQLQRVPNTTLSMPATPPVFGFSLTNVGMAHNILAVG